MKSGRTFVHTSNETDSSPVPTKPNFKRQGRPQIEDRFFATHVAFEARAQGRFVDIAELSATAVGKQIEHLGVRLAPQRIDIKAFG